jgi:hypothetical protein
MAKSVSFLGRWKPILFKQNLNYCGSLAHILINVRLGEMERVMEISNRKPNKTCAYLWLSQVTITMVTAFPSQNSTFPTSVTDSAFSSSSQNERTQKSSSFRNHNKLTFFFKQFWNLQAFTFVGLALSTYLIPKQNTIIICQLQ